MTAYEQGFMDKCAELGVDPAAFVKAAQMMGVGRVARGLPMLLRRFSPAGMGTAFGRGLALPSLQRRMGLSNSISLPTRMGTAFERGLSSFARTGTTGLRNLLSRIANVQIPGVPMRPGTPSVAQAVVSHPQLGARLVASGALSRAKPLEELLTSPEIGALGADVPGADLSWASKLQRLDNARKGLSPTGMPLPPASRGTAPLSEYNLLERLLYSAQFRNRSKVPPASL